MKLTVVTIPPYACAYVVTLLVAVLADRSRFRGPYAAGASLLAFVAFIVQATAAPDAFGLRYGMLCLATIGVFATLPPLAAWVGSNVRTTIAASLGIALNNGIGGLGQIVGVYIYKSEEAKIGYPTGHYTNAALQLVAVLLCCFLMWFYNRRNKSLQPGQVKWEI